MSGQGKTVCVTGGSGFIASWLVKLLLQRGYTVRASVRDLSDPKKTEHLLALHGAKERLHLFKGNLLEEEKELIDPALKGTLNVLGSCTKSPTVKRVVLTSSMASVECIGRPRPPNEITDETWFSNPEFCKENTLWYHLSKTLAEDAAWKFTKEKCIDMVVINPSMVMVLCYNQRLMEVLLISWN
ncbi:unnamed protein product [Camellia sinensis]